MELQTLLNDLRGDRAFERIALNPVTQFAANAQPYLGATLLPERPVRRNQFTEGGVRYRTVIANDGGRYSPAQKKSGGVFVGSFEVSLGNSDIATEFTGYEFDAVLELLDIAETAEAARPAAAQVLGWGQNGINLALVEHNERQRWQAIIDAQIVRKGDNGAEEIVNIPNPAGHRLQAGGDWSDPEYDILGDLMARKRFMSRKGFTLNRAVTSTEVVGVMLQNERLAKAAGKSIITVQGNGTLSQSVAAFNAADLNALMTANGLPTVDTYDRTYFDDLGDTHRFLKRDAFAMFATTGRVEQVQLTLDPNGALAFRPVNNTLGYVAVGRPVGHLTTGRIIRVEAKEDKPPRLQGEGWQSSLPVLTEPDAITVITGITLPN